MDQAKIDNTDIAEVEVMIIFAVGAVFVAYGGTYFWVVSQGKKDPKSLYSCTAMTLGGLLWLQAYLTRRFYVTAIRQQTQKQD